MRAHVRIRLVILLAMMGLAIPSAGAFSESRTFRIPAEIPGLCAPDGRSRSRDVTAEINGWIASVPDGAPAAPITLLFRAGRCYRVDGTIGARYFSTSRAGYRRRHLILDGQGATIDGSHARATTREHRGVLSFVYGADLTVRGFSILGNHPDPCRLGRGRTCRDGGYDVLHEWEPGIAFYATKGVTVEHNRIVDVYGDGVLLGFGWSTAPDQHVTGALIRENVIDGTGRMGVAVVAGAGVRIARNVFDRNSYHVIDLEPEGLQPVTDVAIEGNRLGRYWMSFVSNATADCVRRNSGSITIRGNVDTVGGATVWPAVYIAPYGNTPRCAFRRTWREYVIERNVLIHRGGYWAVRAARVADLVIANNTLRGADPAVNLEHPRRGVRVTRNRIEGGRFTYTVNASSTRRGRLLGSGVRACGNRTSIGRNQPRRCTR